MEEKSAAKVTLLEKELVGDISAQEVRMYQSGAQSIHAQEVHIEQAGARRIEAQEVTIHQGGAQAVHADTVSISQGGAVMVNSGSLDLEQSGVLLATSQDLQMTNSSAGAVVGQNIRADQIRSVLVLAGSTQGEVRTVFDQKSALALGTALGASLGLISILRSLFTRR
ncbi:MAG: hypothetical protein HYX86_06480 [Chloroflexi bacterium]|nr:hypothetical protein [Chloroflexota bacterium]